jgi:hypothetical protein
LLEGYAAGHFSDGGLGLLSSSVSSKLIGSVWDLAEMLGFDRHSHDMKKGGYEEPPS